VNGPDPDALTRRYGGYALADGVGRGSVALSQ
jgi:hypothetical protein